MNIDPRGRRFAPKANSPQIGPRSASRDMSGKGDTVVVIDDDLGIREALTRLLDAAGLEARAFASAESFLDSGTVAETAVLILDIQLPGISGLALQQRLLAEGAAPSTIFITGRDIPQHREGARGLGAPCFIKPFAGLDLIQAVRERLPAA